jgi:hypothetical protein
MSDATEKPTRSKHSPTENEGAVQQTDPFRDLPGPVDESVTTLESLGGRERGVWRVVTRDSSHIFDLDNNTVTRIPGEYAQPNLNDAARQIYRIERCTVGQRGYWLMDKGGYTDTIDYYWHDSSVIQRIERVVLDLSEDGQR